jgi:hypothetical protein
MGCAQGVSGKLVMKEQTGAPTWSGSDPMFEFFSENVKRKRKIGVPNTIRGTRSKYSSRARLAPYVYAGRIQMPVNAGDLAILLPWILGADASGTTFGLAESLQAFSAIFHRVTETYEYQDLVIDKALLYGRAGEGDEPDFMALSMDVLGKARATAVSFPASALAHTAQYNPYVFQDSVFTLHSATREVKEMWLLVDNHVRPRYVNSLSPTALCPSDRDVFLRIRVPYDSGNSNLVDTTVAGAAGTLAITNGAVSTSIAFTNLKNSFDDPTIAGLREIEGIFDFASYHNGTDAEIIITNDSTP